MIPKSDTLSLLLQFLWKVWSQDCGMKESNENSFKRYNKSSEYPTTCKRTEFNQERISGYSYNNRYRSIQSKSSPTLAKSYTINAELEEYESLEETTNTIYVQNCTHNQELNLGRVSAALEVNHEDIPMNMLIDSGATASFISPTRLPKAMANQLEQFLNNNSQVVRWDLKRADFTKRSAQTGILCVDFINASNNNTVMENGTLIGVATKLRSWKIKQRMFKMLRSHPNKMSVKDRNELVKLIIKYADVFQLSEFEMVLKFKIMWIFIYNQKSLKKV
ncbi:hypothetical protein BpHYR1_010328 [Brachionus plicatilis]|uniref:Peptidase A2 domain-containing protein n=1 Tax=Brachionus plicatilis TaxID=10195 RepID=A0A3M7T8X9_BRAPC|nr:hypothetical protein BpHYR1_010328 [Brachionus plicatilis]